MHPTCHAFPEPCQPCLFIRDGWLPASCLWPVLASSLTAPQLRNTGPNPIAYSALPQIRCFAVRDMVGPNPIILVGTKMDLLPGKAHPRVCGWSLELQAGQRMAF
eukprot:360216-Pelagomonas_calceolata.AAC.4